MIDVLPAALRAVAPSLDAQRVESWSTALTEPMRSGGIGNPRRVAAFLGQVSVESTGFTRLEEDLSYSAERLCQVWPARFVIPTSIAARRCAHSPETLANNVYAGRLGNCKQGDGWLYRGRGLIQLTGRANYQAFANAIKRPLDTVPAWLTTPEGAAYAAVWFWSREGLNALADAWRITDISKRINGGSLGLAERIRLSNAALAALGGN